MRLPNLAYSDGIRKTRQVKFGGMNHTRGAKDGEIWSMKNMTSDHHPVMSTREKRYLYRKLENPGGLFVWDKLCWVDGETFYYDGEAKGTVTAGEKTFSALGAFVVILPDKCYYNTITGEFGSMEAKWAGEMLTFKDGLLYEEEAAANAIVCEGTDWAQYFKVGDAVTISGCTTEPKNNQSIIIRAIDGDTLYFYENSFTLPEEKEYQESGALSISRSVPDLKWICENENRLWGCDGTTIYASKLGDIFNWKVYDGLSSDAWAIEPGSMGYFCGAISFRGYPTFFKSEEISKIYGSIPSNFQVMASATLGLEEGSGRSLAIAGETLFYLSRSGVAGYTGGIPQPVCKVFGTEKFRDAVAGSDGLKYYVSMTGEDGETWLYVYDTQRGMWHREDQTRATHFAYWDGNLYMLNDKGEIWTVGNTAGVPDGAQEEATIPWEIEFSDFMENDPNKKGVGKLQVRLELEKDATFEVWMQFDSDGNWHLVKSLVGTAPKRSYYLPLVPRRCDHYRVRLQGTGMCRVYSVAREYYPGSEYKSTRGRN